MASELPWEVIIDIAKQAAFAVLDRGGELADRVRNPLPGDLVVETTLFRCDEEAIGYYVMRLWNIDHPDGEKQDPVNYLWRIHSLSSGAVKNWGNAEFLAVPTKRLRNEVKRNGNSPK